LIGLRRIEGCSYVSNSFSSQPIYIDTDTTYAGNTNWKGSSGGSKYTGGLGIRPVQIIVTPLGATTATEVVINEINSTGGGTGPVLFKVEVPTATSGAATSQPYTVQLTDAGWHDFIVTGASAANVALLIYYRV
jgi:hypothetical protein